MYLKLFLISKMAVTRRGYIFSAFLLSVLCVLLMLVSIASDSWIVSSATATVQIRDSFLQYGLFRGQVELNLLGTPVASTLFVTCLSDMNACAVSCKTTQEAREDEVRALANGFRPNPTCISTTNVDANNPLDTPPVISFAFYVCMMVVIFLQLFFAVTSAGLAIINATRNPTEPIFGLPGCLWSNVVAAVLGVTVMMMFGIHWAVSGLQDHLAFSYIALGQFEPSPSLGYSYWLLIAPILCSLTNVGLIQLRKYLLEQDPQTSTIKVENHSDGTLILY